MQKCLKCIFALLNVYWPPSGCKKSMRKWLYFPSTLSLFRIFRIAFCKLMGDVTMTTSTSCIQSMVMVYNYLLHMFRDMKLLRTQNSNLLSGSAQVLVICPPHFPGVTCPPPQTTMYFPFEPFSDVQILLVSIVTFSRDKEQSNLIGLT